MTNQKEIDDTIREHQQFYRELLRGNQQFFDEPVERQVMFFMLGKQFLEDLMDTIGSHPTEENMLKSIYYKAFLETAEEVRIIYEPTKR